MSLDLNQGSAPSVHIGRTERDRFENRGFVPGYGHPDIPKAWPNLAKGPGAMRRMGEEAYPDAVRK